ncbi:hypothetical protein [Jiulongibacter sp. NS-SX5]|uniref:hypothetical protein n=1 Tax=Jiulongibacter sp. NS-SX5 TaxID=3463854 RepID=UPI0040596100
MRKALSLLLISLLSFQASANEFEFKNSELDQEFAELNALESLVAEQNLTLEEVQSLQPELVSNIELNATASISQTAGEMPVLGPFWWGCCLGIVGLLLVYIITDNDKGQVKTALWGCIVSTILLGGIYGLNPFGWF